MRNPNADTRKQVGDLTYLRAARQGGRHVGISHHVALVGAGWPDLRRKADEGCTVLLGQILQLAEGEGRDVGYDEI